MKMRKQKRRIRLFLSIGMLVILSICSLLLLKDTDSKKKVQVPEGREDKQYCERGTILVNKDNPLPQDYEVELVTLSDGRNQAAREAYGALCNMLEAGKKEGLQFVVCSAYRSVERQTKLFEEDVQKLIQQGYSYLEAYKTVAEETMPPGCSEHSTGLAFDIVAMDYQMLDEGQEKTTENMWLQEHCTEYGFILRYPKGREDITGISYESWHFRYVGESAAAYIVNNGITLEEYLGEF